MEKTTTKTTQVKVFFTKKVEGNTYDPSVAGNKVIRMTDVFAKELQEKMDAAFEPMRKAGINIAPVKIPKLAEGDGDIDTKHSSQVNAELKLSYSQTVLNGKKEALIKFRYMIATEEKKDKYDVLGMDGSFTISLSQYNTNNTWTCGNKTYTLTTSYTMDKGEATIPYTFKNKFEKYNYWYIPIEEKKGQWVISARFKIDGKQNELKDKAQIGFEMGGFIPITVTRTLTVTEVNPFDENKDIILAKDKKAKTIEELLGNHKHLDLHDGYETEQIDATPKRGTGAWVCHERSTDNKLIKEFYLPKKTDTELYPGAIVKIDENLIGGMPNMICLKEKERLPLKYTSKIESLDKYIETLVPNDDSYNRYFGDLMESFRKKAIESGKKIDSGIEISYSEEDRKKGFGIGCSLGNLSYGKVSIGGDLTLGIGAGSKENFKVIQMRQELFEVHIDASLKKVGEILTPELDLENFKEELGHYTPGIISKVQYGKVAYIILKLKGDSSFDINIGSEGFAGAKDGDFDIDIRTFGGNQKDLGPCDFASANTFIKKFYEPIQPEDIETATPIAYEVHYLDKPSESVTVKKYNYTLNYVDKVKIRIIDNNTGVSAQAHLKCMDLKYTNNKFHYEPEEIAKGTGTRKEKSTIEVSPWATCIQADIDVIGSISKDFSIFIPYIPINKIKKQANDGSWVFDIMINGSSLIDVQEKSNIDPIIPGTYINYGGKADFYSDYKYSKKEEDELITDFFEFCERNAILSDKFKKLGNEKKVKNSRD